LFYVNPSCDEEFFFRLFCAATAVEKSKIEKIDHALVRGLLLLVGRFSGFASRLVICMHEMLFFFHCALLRNNTALVVALVFVRPLFFVGFFSSLRRADLSTVIAHSTRQIKD
jgi:hypothetical protein